MLASLVSVMTTAWLLAAPAEATGPTCRSIDGHVACGYQCKSDGQRLKCAQTPQGTCQLLDGQAVCFDPPAYIVRVYGSELPAPECKMIDGQVACGYQCITQFGKVRCARTPAGICGAREGEIICFDPPPELYAVYGREIPRAECKGLGATLACGYKCTQASGQIACNTTPLGACKSDGRQLKCFDPPAQAVCAWGKTLPAPRCHLGDGQPVCGYNCASAFFQTACAATPKGVCKVFDSQVYCFDPPAAQEGDPECLKLLGMATLDTP